MPQFVGRRLLLLLPVMIGVVLVTFLIVRLIPGNPCVTMLGERATPAKCEAFMDRYGLNDNVFVQFGRYLLNMVKGDFGDSIRFTRPVVDLIAERLPMTMELTILAMIFSTTVGVLLGVISALRRNTILDTLTMVIANIGVSMPVFWLGLLLAYLFALVLKDTAFVLPPSGRFSAGLSLTNLADFWGLTNVTGFRKFVIDLLSNTVLINAIITGIGRSLVMRSGISSCRRLRWEPSPCQSSPA